MIDALLGTHTGVYRLHNGNLSPLGPEDQNISAIHARSTEDGTISILAGSYGNGLFRSADGGKHWTPVSDGLTAPAFRTIMTDPADPNAILCGTEPARIFRSQDGGESWEEFEDIPALDRSDEWYLPYSPRAGALRNIYSPPGTDRLLAAIEVGGLIDSHDNGASWAYLPILDDTDIHYITGHPADADILFAALGWASLKSVQRSPDADSLGGIARSSDGGRSWTKLFTDYTRAVIVPPSRPNLVLAGPATRVGGHGRIEVSADLGDTWQPAGDGIETPMKDMVEEFVAAPDGSICAICSGGRVFCAEPGEWQWRSPLPDTSDVHVRSITFLDETRPGD